MSETTTVATSTTVEIPTIDERKLEKHFVIVNTIGEVQSVHVDQDDAEGVLRELAKGRACDELPKLFLLEALAVPTDQALAKREAE